MKDNKSEINIKFTSSCLAFFTNKDAIDFLLNIISCLYLSITSKKAIKTGKVAVTITINNTVDKTVSLKSLVSIISGVNAPKIVNTKSKAIDNLVYFLSNSLIISLTMFFQVFHCFLPLISYFLYYTKILKICQYKKRSNPLFFV
jgi:hypothetical protein